MLHMLQLAELLLLLFVKYCIQIILAMLHGLDLHSTPFSGTLNIRICTFSYYNLPRNLPYRRICSVVITNHSTVCNLCIDVCNSNTGVFMVCYPGRRSDEDEWYEASINLTNRVYNFCQDKLVHVPEYSGKLLKHEMLRSTEVRLLSFSQQFLYCCMLYSSFFICCDLNSVLYFIIDSYIVT